MTRRGVRHVLVVEGSEGVGLVSIRDLLGSVATPPKKEVR